MNVKDFQNLFSAKKPIIGVVHLLSLPGSPNYAGSLEKVIERALKDAKAIERNNLNGLIVENYGDHPFAKDSVPPEVVSTMSVVVYEIKKHIKIPVGVNVLRNDSISALAIATICGADFIRVNVHIGVMVTDQGIIEGNAYQSLRYRSAIKSNVKIFADVLVKHASLLGSPNIKVVAQDTVSRGLADALIVSGERTGEETNIEKIKGVKNSVEDVPVIVGSGVNEKNISETLKYCDGIIIGTAIKKDGITENEVEPKRIKRLLSKINY
jgi:membrane complex biogenesis BtpA family protein